MGAGSRFDIYLPALVIEEETQTTNVLETAVPGQGQRLLVIEDEPALREALVESLELWHYEVLTSANGEEALALLAQDSSIDLIVSDVIMPKMGGLAFVQALRQRGLNTRVIFISGHPVDMPLATLQALGVHEVLPKPLDPVRLSQAIAAALP